MVKALSACICATVLMFGDMFIKPQEPPFQWVTDSTVALIENFEGKRYSAYQDSQGNWTIGIGHLIRHVERHMLRIVLTEAQVKAILHDDLDKCSEALKTALTVPVTRTQSDALHSLCHNIGPDRMISSNVIKHMNNNQPQKAADAFLEWSKPAVLKRRRQAERAVFLAEI